MSGDSRRSADSEERSVAVIIAVGHNLMVPSGEYRGMDRKEALEAAQRRREGVAEWNRRRESGESIPDLSRGRPQRGRPQRGRPQRGRPQRGRPQRGRPQRGRPQRGRPQQGPTSAGPTSAGPTSAGPTSAGPPQRGRPQRGQPQQGHSIWINLGAFARYRGLEAQVWHTPQEPCLSTVGIDTLVPLRREDPRGLPPRLWRARCADCDTCRP